MKNMSISRRISGAAKIQAAVFLLLSAGVWSAHAQTQEATPASHLAQLRQSVRAGTLPNGFRYAVVPTGKLPPQLRGEHVLMRLHVDISEEADGGELMELPHILEHVLVREFRTPEGTYLTPQELWRRWGTSKGFVAEPSRYGFSVPKAKVGEGIGYLRLIAHGTRMDAEDIRSETSIVKGEILRYSALAEGAPGEAFAGRTLGASPTRTNYTLENRLRSLENTRPEDVARFYASRYRADSETLYVVGDVDAVAIEREIRQIFSDVPRGASASARPLPPPDLSKGLIKYLPGLRVSTSTLLLGYSAPEPSYDMRKQAVHVVLAQMLQAGIDERAQRFGFPAQNVRVDARVPMPREYASGIDFEFTALPGEFGAAAFELFSVMKTFASGEGEAEFEKAKSDFQAMLVSSSGTKCLEQSSIYSGLHRATLAGRFGQLDCEEDESIHATDIEAVTMADVRGELTRLLDPRHFGFRALARTGDRQIGLSLIYRALAERRTSSFANPAAHLATPPRIVAMPDQSPTLSLLPVRDNIFRVEGGGSGAKFAIYIERDASIDTFSLRIFGAPNDSLPKRDRDLTEAISRLADMSGFGGLNSEQLKAYLDENQLRLQVDFGNQFNNLNASVSVSGPLKSAGEGLNLLYHVLRGPDLNPLIRREFGRRSVSLKCDSNLFNGIVDSTLRFNRQAPATWRDACVRSLDLPSDAKVKAIWMQLLGNPEQWTLVARGPRAADLAAGFRSLAERMPAARLPSRPVVVTEPTGKHFVIERGYGPEVSVRVLMPLILNGIRDPEGAMKSLEAAFPGMGRFYHRIRFVESGAYAPTASVYWYPGKTDRALVQIEFVCDPADTKRLIEATWDEFRKIRESGLNAEEAGRVNALMPSTIRRIDEVRGPARYALTQEEAATTRTVTPIGVDDVLKLIRKAKREDMIIFELRP